MDALFERVAGLDVAKATVTVCVRTPGPGGRRVSQTRTFRTMTRHLQVAQLARGKMRGKIVPFPGPS